MDSYDFLVAVGSASGGGDGGGGALSLLQLVLLAGVLALPRRRFIG